MKKKSYPNNKFHMTDLELLPKEFDYILRGRFTRNKKTDTGWSFAVEILRMTPRKFAGALRSIAMRIEKEFHLSKTEIKRRKN
jgi:hypothetical protein